MNIYEAKEELRRTVLAYTKKDGEGNYVIPMAKQRPLLLIGPPGIGKTAIMEQVAEECQVGLVSYTITHHTRQSAIGLPVIRERSYDGHAYSITEYTMSEIIASVYSYMEETGKREGILFIDEINCVSETLAPAMLQFLQCKTFGSHQVPEGWIIAAAGNPPQYNKSVREFDVVTLDRVRLLQLEEDLQVWEHYALDAHVHPAILAFLAIKPQDFYRMESYEGGRSFVTARGWEDLSRMLLVYEDLGLPVDAGFVQEFLQYPMIAADFASYYKSWCLFKGEYDIAGILAEDLVPDQCQTGARLGSDPGPTPLRPQPDPWEERVSLIYLLFGALEDCRDAKRWNRGYAWIRSSFGEGVELEVFQRLVMNHPKVMGWMGNEPVEEYIRCLERHVKEQERAEHTRKNVSLFAALTT